ncbi:MAG: tRNA (N6-isopentenyl adenosine(37)-C2)-methylthiotransferase MiaB [Tenericutes bacterium GWC2_34_14]|nr:MAG: tRNA (N6-isopentenyl adenosine(37)-C2)-methylthiotransferase MiaB [Tenericutes bacterium GWA2_35_7]OHE28499.1 MAG: tRNA (N6-isopentenyl adenosine(37)-C2)-methylthiotransferase MiaB [Tenericutes bacterium GWC2_34_14]OHE33593.1 MAG: tRNA (N6-isopentenyl adenosine(37)-C2)-methylthiotransferase MiaB [Tenericutes bacterium GWE2_34_108]OHE36878.1 MAG: tRNA (N6-isopentenyl adenosine(37)-C2)-methylthiotransferase MiaB [Tenericutes bacterium GWF1_35_14]OHE38042.1 MAG: tRNA (N6-isopentenyl adenos
MNNVDLEKYFKPDLNQARKRSKKTVEELKFQLDDAHEKVGLGKTYKIDTYGCQGNEADSETMAGILELMGFAKTEEEHQADVIIINTCAIRENAENRIWGELGRLKAYKRQNPNLILGLAGCMAQEENVVERVLKKYQHVDIVFGTHNIHKLPEYIETAMFNKERVIEVFSREGEIIENLPKVRQHHFKAWVNIMFGCDEFCTYCIVPYTRGKERSRSKDEVIAEVKELVKQGYQEVTLLGQNVNAYGKDIKTDDYTFGDLLRDLNETGIERIRFTTSHPHDLDLKTMEAMRDCKHVMPFFHLPVQSGSNPVLKKMNRHYTKESYLKTLNELKETVPGISVTTDIIVGFPGETEEDFMETMDLVEKAQFEGAFTFVFSKREGTPAATFEDSTPEEEKKQRLYMLNDKINAGYLKGNERFVGETVKVLVDGVSKYDDTVLAGYSEHNKLVNFKGDKSLIGKIVSVKITLAKTWFLMGEAL